MEYKERVESTISRLRLLLEIRSERVSAGALTLRCSLGTLGQSGPIHWHSDRSFENIDIGTSCYLD